MKDYSLTEEERKNYVMEYDYSDKEHFNLYVKFPKTKTTKKVYFKNLLASDDNIAKLDKKMEEQMDRAIKYERKFVIKRNQSLQSSILEPMAGMVITGVVANNIEADTTKIVIAGGIVTLAGFIPCLVKHLKDRSKVKEIEKAKYLQEHKEDLKSLQDYPNALTGARARLVNLIENEKEPFKINNLEFFTKEDLEGIVTNIEREKKFGFDYEVTGYETETNTNTDKVLKIVKQH